MPVDPATLVRLVRNAVLLAVLAAGLLAAPVARAQTTDPVGRTLDAIAQGGQVDPVIVDAWKRDWVDARRAARELDGTEQAHVRGVVRNTTSLARRNMLVARISPAMLIVQRNVEWFWRDRQPAPANGTRRAFSGSNVVFQLYGGNGWQFQPLANMGTLNSLSKRRRISERTRTWAADLLELAVRRNGALAFEYLFPWAGGEPGWVSAMPQAVALEAFARLGMRAEAREMLEVFRQEPPSGVRYVTAPGRAHYVLYAQNPRLLIGNGFAQAVLSLQAYLALEPDDPAVREAYDVALAEARATMAQYDTGAWSLYYYEPGYGGGEESDLHYHRLFKDFLGVLCDRIGGEPFCTMEANFARYETEPVRFGTPRIAPTRRLIRGRVYVSKRSSIRVTLYRDDEPVDAVTLGARRGTFRVNFDRPRRGGEYRMAFSATALTGQRSETEVATTLRRRR